MSNKLVADEISRIMFKKNLTQKKLGDLFGVSQQTAGEWQRRGNLPQERFDQFKEIFGVDIEIIAKAGQEISIGDITDNIGSTIAGRDITGGISYPTPSHQYACELICDADEATAKKIIKMLINNVE